MVQSTGNVHGAVRFVADAVAEHPDDGARQYLVSSQASRSRSATDQEYLWNKGVFAIPNQEACKDLIRDYFSHFHPLLPILDAAAFLRHFEVNGHTAVNPLLLWSMILVAAGVGLLFRDIRP